MFENEYDTKKEEKALSPLKHDWEGRFARKGKKKTPIQKYFPLIDSILVIIYITLLLATDFILFAGSGNIEVFHQSIFPITEVSVILLGFLIFTIIIVLLVQKRQILKHLLASFFTLVFVYAIYQQFYQFKQFTALGDLSVPTSIIIGFVLAGFTYAVFQQTKMLYKVLWVLAVSVMFFQVYISYMHHSEPHEFIESHNQQKVIERDTGKKFIYFMFPNLVSYPYFSTVKTTEAKETKQIIQGFYQKNKFNVYPRAYAKNDEYLRNMISLLNLTSNKTPDNYITNYRLLSEYWRFYNLRNEHIKLKRNELFNIFKINHFQLSAYKSRDFDMCQVEHKYNIDRCIEKVNQPTNIYSLDLSALSKINILVVEWLSSMKLFKNMSSLYAILNSVTNADKMPMVGVNYNNLYVVNSIKTFDILYDNMKQDSGKQAYFVFTDIPSDMYIYDEFCQLKPKDEWLDMANLPWIKKDYTKERQTAYLQQTKCLYGKLEQFIAKLKQDKLWNNTVMVIQGVSGVNNFQNYKEEDYFKNFIGNRLVNLAIYDAKNKQSNVYNDFCSANSILAEYMFHQDICSKEQLNVHTQMVNKIEKYLNILNDGISNKHIKDFQIWYNKWSEINGEKIDIDTDTIKKTASDITDDFGIDDLNSSNTPQVNLNPNVFTE